MHKVLDEILEAAWAANEEDDRSVENLRRLCPIEISAKELEQPRRNGLLELRDGEVHLTERGAQAARSVVRRHRLAVTLFATVLDMDPERREAIACEVEHTLLPEVEEGICTLLGHPVMCPDGKPIPPGRCCSTNRTHAPSVIVNLTSLEPGESGRIAYIKPKNHSRLHRLASFGLNPGTVVEVHQRSPAICIRFGGTELALNRDVAEDIYVARIG